MWCPGPGGWVGIAVIQNVVWRVIRPGLVWRYGDYGDYGDSDGEVLMKRNGSWSLLFGLVLFVCAIGCGHAVSPRGTSVAGQHGHRYRLEFAADPALVQCNDQDVFREHLSSAVRDTIDSEGKRVLRVGIEYPSVRDKRVRIELLDERGSTVEKVDQLVGAHMDCARVVRLAAGLASAVVEKTLPLQRTSTTEPEPQRRHESIPKLKPDPEPLRRPVNRDVERSARNPMPNSSAYAPEASNQAPTSGAVLPPTQVPLDIKVRVSTDQGEKEEPSLASGAYLLGGVGILRGHDPNLNAGLRFGIGYGIKSVALEADLFGVGSILDVGTKAAFQTQAYALMLNLALCWRAPPLGLCLLGSAMQDGVPTIDEAAAAAAGATKSAADSEMKFSAAFGAGTRAWLQIPLGSAWALRANLEMTVPLHMFQGAPAELRVWRDVTPTAAVVATLVHAL